MTMNRYNQTEILEALNRLTESEEKILDSNLLNEVEDRVWLSISQSISNQQSSMPMPNNIQLTPNSQLNSNWSQWWQRKHRLVLVFLGSFVIFTIIALSAYNLALRWNKKQAQPDSIEPIPLQELSSKAEAKFVKLSNGISFQEVQQAINTPTNNPRSAMNQPTHSPINEKLKEEVQNKEDPNNLTVFFTEFEEKYFLPKSLPFANFDITKKLIVQSWISGSFYKNIHYYDNKIVNFSVGTPEYQISYLGGKYAIKGMYTQPYHLSGITAPSPKDVEVELLKNLLNPINLNKVVDFGLQTIDNKKLRVIEVRRDPLPSIKNEYNSSSKEEITEISGQSQNTSEYITNTSTKYYFDQNDLSLHLVEDYTNNQLLKQTKITKSQILEKQQASKLFHYQELGNLPIKEYKIYIPNPNDFLISGFVEKYDLYYIPELGIENIYYSPNPDEYTNSPDSNYYYYDPDFNPDIKQELLNISEDVPSLPKNYLASYYQNSLEVSIYEEDKPKYEDMFLYGKQARLEVKKERNVQILLNEDQPTNGKYLELALKFEDGNTAQNGDQYVKTFLVIEFKVGKYWYILGYDLKDSTISSSANSFDLKSYLSQEQIRFSKLTLEQAREIDKKNQKSYNYNENNTPPYQSNNLDQKELDELISRIPEDMLILPGDLSQKYYLFASHISYNEINDPDYKSRLLEGGCYFIECFLDYKKTLVIDFNKPDDPENLYSLRVIVLDLEMNKLDFENLRRMPVVFHNDLEESKIPQFKNADLGIKYISGVGVTYVFIPFKNKTIVMQVSGYALKEQDYLSIARGMGVKKDLERIKEQIVQRQKQQSENGYF